MTTHSLERRQKAARALAAYNRSAVGRRNARNARLKQYSDPAQRCIQSARMSARMTLHYSDPLNRRKQSIRKLQLWRTDAYRKTIVPKLLSFKSRYCRPYNGPKGNYVFRSSWELAFAYALDALEIRWEYEPRTFYFPKESKWTSYTPDFYLPDHELYVEIKGRLTKKNLQKLSAFHRYFSERLLCLRKEDMVRLLKKEMIAAAKVPPVALSLSGHQVKPKQPVAYPKGK